MFNSAVFKKLEKKDFRTLLGIEAGMKSYQWVPLEMIPAFSKLRDKEVLYRIDRLLELEVIKKTIVPYEGCKIYFKGYDMLALGMLTRRGLSAIGERIGVGKESVVYEGIYDDAPVILKFHRAGQTSFKQVTRQRDTGTRDHWIFIAGRAAWREHEALVALHDSVAAPRCVDYNRHVVVMSVAPGCELSKTTVDDPEWFLDRILEQVRKAYEFGFIHSDLSEYNVFVSPDGVEIIDWPGYVTTKHPQADYLLNRDVKNILTIFNRKYGAVRDHEKVVGYVKGL
ncbi:MAG: serine/threonine protein kinase [Methanosarcinales archaeon]|nr:MAG: serine/threonine protein kinase [Methanosarcinales archaeon]